MSREDDAKRLLRSMNDIDDNYVRDAAQIGGSGKSGMESEDRNEFEKKPKKRPKRVRFRRAAAIIAAAAACLLVVTVITREGLFRAGSSSSSSSESYDITADSEDSAGTAEMDYGVASSGTAGEDNDAEAAEYEDEDNAAENSAASTAASAEEIQKKIVYSGDIVLQTKEYDTAKDQMDELISQYGGFVESSSEYDNGSETQSERSYYVTARIPASDFDDFMNGLGEISGKIISQNITSSDMTRAYSDNADRIKALETEQETLLDLLSRSDSVDDMIAIQAELANVRTELAELNRANNGIDYDVHYSTVSVELDEVVSYETTQISFGERITNAFGASGTAFLHVLQGLLVAIIFLIPYAVIAAVIILLIRYIRKKKKRK